MNIDYKLLGGRIKTKRRERGITQEQLAESLAVSVGYVSQLERGITKTNLETLARLSRLLSCNISYFVGDAVTGKQEYLGSELLDKFAELSDNEKQIVIDLIDSLRKNRG